MTRGPLRKGIILAGGKGSRLGDCTKSVSKQLLPVYDKPMIYYPLTVLLSMGVKEIAIITTPDQMESYYKLLGVGVQFGVNIVYFEQPEPRGLADAYLICSDWLNGDPSCMVLGDNIMHGSDVTALCKMVRMAYLDRTALITGYRVMDPRQYGVVSTVNEYDIDGITFADAVAIEEKPENPRSKMAVPGLYLLGGDAPEWAKDILPSPRGELEIVDLLNRYAAGGWLKTVLLSPETAWFDAGTPDGLLDASNYIAASQKRTGIKIGCPFTLER